jgi:hypothetical protein
MASGPSQARSHTVCAVSDKHHVRSGGHMSSSEGLSSAAFLGHFQTFADALGEVAACRSLKHGLDYAVSTTIEAQRDRPPRR